MIRMTVVVGGDFSWNLNSPDFYYHTDSDWKSVHIAVGVGAAVRMDSSSMKRVSSSLTRSRVLAYYSRPYLENWQ